MVHLSLFPIAYADVDSLVYKVNKVIINPLIFFMFAVALMYFIYGVFEFISNSENEEKRTAGKSHMLWGVIGMFIMVAVFTIMSIITNTLGVKYIKDPATNHGGQVDIQ